MDHLWTPWRYRYITQAGEQDDCIFCAAAAASDDRDYLVVHRGLTCFVILNRYPYTNGHVMVVPYQHLATVESLPEATAAELIRLAQRTEAVLRAVYRPEGLNMGINIGKCAGAGVAGHVHMHILPRWTGDSSFMTTTGETRILPEDLDTTWEKLSDAFGRAKGAL
jgi:ATP adenylyltransferase